jgi:hypothetical protein
MGGGMSSDRAAFEALDDYQLGSMNDADAASFEDSLFEASAAGTADEAVFIDQVSLIMQYLGPRGGLDNGSTRQRIEQVKADGLRVQVLAPEPGPVLRIPPIDPDAEIVVTHIPIDVRGWDSLDVEVSLPDGRLIKTFRDVNPDPEDGTLYALCEAPLARLSAANQHLITRVIGHRAGKTETVAQFETLATL